MHLYCLLSTEVQRKRVSLLALTIRKLLVGQFSVILLYIFDYTKHSHTHCCRKSIIWTYKICLKSARQQEKSKNRHYMKVGAASFCLGGRQRWLSCPLSCSHA